MKTSDCYLLTSLGARVAVAALILAAPTVVALNGGSAAYAQALPSAKEAEATGTYSVEKSHSNISFNVTHLGITKVPGHFSDFSGTVIVDGKKVQNSSVEFTIKAASVSTDEPKRDEHLKSDAFFDVVKFPDIVFKSERISKRRDGYAAIGKLTMHGVTKDVVLPFGVAGPVMGMDKKPHIGVSIELKLKRSDYGITYGPGVVSDDVNVSIDLDLVKQS